MHKLPGQGQQQRRQFDPHGHSKFDTHTVLCSGRCLHAPIRPRVGNHKSFFAGTGSRALDLESRAQNKTNARNSTKEHNGCGWWGGAAGIAVELPPDWAHRTCVHTCKTCCPVTGLARDQVQDRWHRIMYRRNGDVCALRHRGLCAGSGLLCQKVGRSRRSLGGRRTQRAHRHIEHHCPFIDGVQEQVQLQRCLLSHGEFREWGTRPHFCV